MDLAFTLTADAPIALRAGRSTEQSITLPYIPGSSLLGALAAAHQQCYPTAHEQFAAFFLQGLVRVGNAYPADFAGNGLGNGLHAVAPLPFTARSCKRRPGFRSQSTEDRPRHGVSDQLAAWTVFALSGERTVAPLHSLAVCSRCQEPSDAVEGFYRRTAAGQYGRSEKGTTIQTHTGIDRNRGTVQQGVLFNRMALPRGSRFWLWAHVEDSISRAFRTFVDEVADLGLWRVGTGRTRGLGRLQADARELDDDANQVKAVEQRVLEFDRQLRAIARDAHVPTPHRRYVPFTLTSDLLLHDALLRWTTRLDGDVLAEGGIEGATLIYHAARVSRVMGWNALLGLPRSDAMAIAMGSVFVYGFDREPVYAALARLQHHGLGIRRDVGYGRLDVAAPFHCEVQNA